MSFSWIRLRIVALAICGFCFCGLDVSASNAANGLSISVPKVERTSIQDGPDKEVQEWNRDWFGDRAEQDAFMRSLKLAAAENPELHGSVALFNDLLTGQPLGSTGQRFGLDAVDWNALANADFRADLDISDSQFQELQALQSEWSSRLEQELKSQVRGDTTKLLAAIRDARLEAEESLQSVLLPPQRRRLEQAVWEQQLRRRSLATLLSEAPLRETLGVTDRQAAEIRDLEEKLEQEIADEIVRLQQAARKRVLAKLSPQQQAEAERILGPALFAIPAKKSNRSQAIDKK